MSSAERLTRPKALAALSPAGPPPTMMASYVGIELSGMVKMGNPRVHRKRAAGTKMTWATAMIGFAFLHENHDRTRYLKLYVSLTMRTSFICFQL